MLHRYLFMFALPEFSWWHQTSSYSWSVDNKKLCHRGSTICCYGSASPDLSSMVSFWHSAKSSVSGRIPITENNCNVQPCLHLLEAEGELPPNTDEASLVQWKVVEVAWMSSVLNNLLDWPDSLFVVPSKHYTTLYGYFISLQLSIAGFMVRHVHSASQLSQHF